MASPKVKLEGKKIAEKVMDFMDEHSFDPIYKEIEESEDFHVFLKALHYLYKCNEWIKKDDEKNKEQPKEPVFNKGNKIMYTIKDSNGNTYPVRRLSERVYESREHKTLFITDEERVVTGIYKEK